MKSHMILSNVKISENISSVSLPGSRQFVVVEGVLVSVLSCAEHQQGPLTVVTRQREVRSEAEAETDLTHCQPSSPSISVG